MKERRMAGRENTHYTVLKGNEQMKTAGQLSILENNTPTGETLF